MSTLLQDISHAIRGLRKRPGFLVAALLTLAVGIGANVTVFSIVNALLLRPLPFGDRSDRVVTLHSTHRLQAEDWGDSDLSYRDLLDCGGKRRRSRASAATCPATSRSRPTPMPSACLACRSRRICSRCSASNRCSGATSPSDEAAAPGLETSVILTHGLWQRRFGGDPGIIGRAVTINDRARTVVGVMPPRFKFPERSELFMPLRWDEAPRSGRSIAVIGVLKHGVSIAQAQGEVDRDCVAPRGQPTRDRTAGTASAC